ncbi:DUF417 family protein [Pedobacter caeni]|uniref:Uncharacterized membrane protein YkgB n=1 Tax=Pedobacter caeni TaxID=288992 RepID=A0A1M5L7U5_9SPHI|nr:DUF417 family protein [Pedobacter caeni]SHG61172.1 Uncharacterized membrane protein YkgB [Pedobacter caeni]
MKNYSKFGYGISVIGVALVLIWIGIFKFTQAEANAIKGLVEHSFLMSWMLKISSLQGVSNFIGVFEIGTGLLLVASFWNKNLGKIGAALSVLIFLTTISFLFTTPGVWRSVEGVPITDFFILKDLTLLGVSLQVLDRSIP